jgi:Glycosyltransferase WbsX
MRSQPNSTPADALKILSFFLPQFHDDPYNDKWWGKGFNEWVNVKAAEPLFTGHDQPRVPQDGYFKYEDAEQLISQFDTARQYGIDGFVFYHYWSKGTRLLKKPLEILLSDERVGQNSNFALCWANHSWTRSWKNRQGANDVLLEQGYENTDEQMLEHVRFLVQCFNDKRYLKLQGAPLLFLYRPEAIPNLNRFVELLNRETMDRLGSACHISGMVTTWQTDWSYLDGLSSVTFAQPATSLYAPIDVFSQKSASKTALFSPSSFARSLPDWAKKFLYPIQDRFFDKVTYFDYEKTWNKLLAQMNYGLTLDRTVHFSSFVDFDNTARYGKRARIFRGFSPQLFEEKMKEAIQLAQLNRRSGVLLINAWNEWAEGMYLQPDATYGNARLEAILQARRAVSELQL